MLDLMGVAAKERQRQLLEEAERYRLAANARRDLHRERGRHRTPFSLTGLGESTTAGVRHLARRARTALGQLGRDLSAGTLGDTALPKLQDYPGCPELPPRHRA